VKRTGYLYAGVATVALGAAFGLSLEAKQSNQALVPPTFVVDATWPKPLPNNWVTGEVGGTCVDSNDHVFVVTRGFQTGGLVSPEGLGGADMKTGTFGGVFQSKPSPPFIEFDQDGNVVAAFGDPSLVPAGTNGPKGNSIAGQNAGVPNSFHGCYIDYQDNIWVGGNGDGIVQKYSHSGQLLMTIGTKYVCDGGTGANDPGIPCTGTGGGNVSKTGLSHTLLNLPADIAVDPMNGDIYIADGYGNHRVVVFDKNGNYLRQMGSVGSGPGQFTTGGGGHPHCVVLGKDGLVYACDRGQDRINVYQKDGTFVRAIPVVPGTGLPGMGLTGSAWDVDFSPDAAQTFMYESDGTNEIMWIMDHAAAMSGAQNSILSGFGGFGHQAGAFTFLHMMAIDSKGNLYAGETVGGRRIQKFTRASNCPGNSEGHGNAGLYQCPGNSGH